MTAKDLKIVSVCNYETKQHALKKPEVFANPNSRDIQHYEIVNIVKLKLIIDKKDDFKLGSLYQDGLNIYKATQLTLLKSYYETFYYQV